MKRLLILLLLLLLPVQSWATITFVKNGSFGADATSTTVAVTLATVTAGNAIMCAVSWGVNTGSTLSVSDGTSTFTNGTLGLNTTEAPDENAAIAYLLSSVASGSVTYTATFGTTSVDRRIHCWEFAYTGTMSFDVQNTSIGSSTAPNSGNITTTGTDEVVLGTAMIEGGGTVTASAPLVNGVAAGGSILNHTSTANSWYRILTATFTGGAASCTFNTSEAWVSNVVALKATAAAGDETFGFRKRLQQ